MLAVQVAWYKLVRQVARGAFWLFGGLRRLHQDQVPPTGGVIIAAAHFSHCDPPAIACAMSRPLRFMAKEELFRVPGLGWLIRSLNAFPIKRGDSDSESVRNAIRLVQEGAALLMFPEGTRGNGLSLGPLSKGIAMLAKRTGAKVVPVGLSGTHRLLPKGASKPKRAQVTVAFGEPISFRDFEGNADPRQAFVDELERRLLSLCGEAGLQLKSASSSEQPTAGRSSV